MLKRLKWLLFAIFDLFVCLFFGLFGAKTSESIIVLFFKQLPDTSAHPDRTNPIFWIWLVLLILGMIFGFISAIFGVLIPLHAYFKIPFNDRVHYLKIYARTLDSLIKLHDKGK